MKILMNRRMLLMVPVVGMAAALALMPSPKVQASTTGKDLFEQRCGGCHALDSDKQGPRLRGVYGRKSASVSAFSYSDALKNAHITWDAETLDKWLTEPDKVVPDNDMPFRVEKPEERRGIIAYLKTLPAK
jgi:cytochrome c